MSPADELWDGATEVELLRTVCHELGIASGEDEFGWWAAMSSGALRRRTYMGINAAHVVSPGAAAIALEPCTTRSAIDR
jgi:hypothetical protein